MGTKIQKGCRTTSAGSKESKTTKQVPGLRDMKYSDRLKHLKLPTLVFRRIRGDIKSTK